MTLTENYPAHLLYEETCFIAVTNSGLVIMQVVPGGDDEPVAQLWRYELPRGPVGEEMWERLSTGLRLRRV